MELLEPADLGKTATPLVIVRTPKSASTTLISIVRQAFPGAREFVLPNTLDLESRLSLLQRLRHVRHAARVNYAAHRVLRTSAAFRIIDREAGVGDLLLGGHVDFATCRRNMTKPVKFVALVRNPAERAASEYFYARAGFERKPPWSRFDASFVAKSAGRYSFEGYLDRLSEHREIFADIACRHIGLTPRSDIAGHVAAHAFAVGVVDDLRAFSNSLTRKTGRTIDVFHLNAISRPPHFTLSTAERRKIERLYANDVALYEWCRKQAAQPSVARPEPRASDARRGVARHTGLDIIAPSHNPPGAPDVRTGSSH